MSKPAIGYEKSAQFYDLFANNEDLPFFLELAENIEDFGPILDLAAGTGRVSFALAKAGFSVWSLEKSPAMLTLATKKLNKMSSEVVERVRLIKGDMSAFALDQKFPLIIIPQSFGHCVTTDQQLACLLCIRQHLTKRGICALDIYQGSSFERKSTWEDELRVLDSKRNIKRSGTYEIDPITQLISYQLKYEIFDDEKKIEELEEFSHAAIIYPREANLLIRFSGFSIFAEYGGWNKVPFDHSSRIRILLLKLSSNIE
ncbi:MAG: class I SAM-dependent methyltransferase [Candidatus Hodarchaeota archaeon]